MALSYETSYGTNYSGISYTTSDGTNYSDMEAAKGHEERWLEEQHREQERAAQRAAWLVIVNQFADEAMESPEAGPGRSRLVNSVMRWHAWLLDHGYRIEEPDKEE